MLQPICSPDMRADSNRNDDQSCLKCVLLLRGSIHGSSIFAHLGQAMYLAMVANCGVATVTVAWAGGVLCRIYKT